MNDADGSSIAAASIYFIEFILVEFLFIVCKVIGYKSASNLGFFIGKNFGNFFRKKKSILENLDRC